MTRAPSSLSAYVLHSHAWSETSLILELFSREQGRLLVVAKGAKRPYSQMRAVLLPFQRLTVQLSRPRSVTPDAQASQPTEVLTLKAAEWGESDGAPWTNGAVRPCGLPAALLLSGFYLNELILRLSPRCDAWPEVFDAYAWALSALARSGDELAGYEPAAVLRAFECVALHASGCLPDLRCEAMSGRSLEPDAAYTLAPELGLMACLPPPQGGQAHRAALSGRAWLALQAGLEGGLLPALLEACALPAPHDGALRRALRGVLELQLSQLGIQSLGTPRVAREAQSL